MNEQNNDLNNNQSTNNMMPQNAQPNAMNQPTQPGVPLEQVQNGRPEFSNAEEVISSSQVGSTRTPGQSTQEAAPNNINQAPRVQPINNQNVNVTPINQIQNSQNVGMNQQVQNNNLSNTTQQVDIVKKEALNPLANEPVQSPTQNYNNVQNGVITPNTQFNNLQQQNGAMNSTAVGFVASASPLPKKKNKGLIAAMVIIIIGALVALGWFVVYPFIVKTYLSDPKNVYEATIRTAFKQINNTVTDVVHDKAIFNIQATLDSNIEELADFSGYTYELNAGVDPKLQALQAGFSIKDKSNVGHSYYTYLKDGKEYVRYSTYRDLIYKGEANLEELNDEFASMEEIFNTTKKLNQADINYIINKVADLLVESIDEKKLSKEDASINIKGETLKVTNNKYTVDYTTLVNMVDHILTGLTEDDESVRILSEMYGVTEDEFKEGFSSLRENLELNQNEDKEVDDTSIIFGIYTYGLKNDIIGYSMSTTEDDSELHYYAKDGYFELKALLVSNDIETNTEEETIIEVLGEPKNKITNVSIKINDEELATLVVNEWTENSKDVDYSISFGELGLDGFLRLSKDTNDERAKYGLEFDVNTQGQEVKVTLDITEDWTSEVANINTGTAVTLDETQLQEKENEFFNTLTSTPLGILVSTVSGDYVSPVEPDMNENNDYEYDYSY